MNMKKALAVVLAVALAISAMAITAFAGEYHISLSTSKTDKGTANSTVVEFSVPVWPEYGYATNVNTLTFTLPSKEYTYEEYGQTKTAEGYNYAIVSGGVTYALGAAMGSADANGNKKYEVQFGTAAHGWDGTSTVIPQSTLVNDNNTVKLVGTFKVFEWNWDGSPKMGVNANSFKTFTNSWDVDWSTFTSFVYPNNAHSATPSYNVKVDAAESTGKTTTSYPWYWAPVDGATIYNNDNWNEADIEDVYWDATLLNKAEMIGAESAKLVVTLNKQLVGNYYFGLIATYANGKEYDMGNNFLGTMDNIWSPLGGDVYGGKYVDFVEITEPTDTITFEVPADVLYSTRYGVFNEYFDIVYVDTAHTGALTNIKSIATAETNKLSSGTFGNYSWTTDSSGKLHISFCGVEVVEGPDWQYGGNQWNHVAPSSMDLYLYTTDVEETPVEDDSEDIEIEAPVESGEEEVETDDVVVDENPTTGVALALVPAALALAVVALKRR